jgi:ribosome-binding factor A
MTGFSRGDRVSGLVQATLSDILRKQISDPRLEMALITGVRMTPDLKTARVYFAINGGKERVEGAKKAFQSAYGYIRKALGDELELRYTPALKFYYDKSYDYGEHIESILKSLN